MEFYLQKAKIFALETAKKSQEIANQAAKLSQELATETAKRSKEIAIDVTKKADQLKAYAGELTPSIVSKGSSTPEPTSEEELQEYGITPELREFVKGLTIRTFMDFPIEAADGGFGVDPKADQIENQTGKDLTPWRERHAVLVLLTVKEISDFRYVLCPRRMNESRFWRIYFTLVNTQIAPYEAHAIEKAAAIAADEKRKQAVQEENLPGVGTRDSGVLTAGVAESPGTAHAVKSKNADNDLDAYLMGALDSSDEGADGDEDDGFDEDFDQLVNSTVDSDADNEESHPDQSNVSKPKLPTHSVAGKTLAGSEGSSDGELVEIPDSESEHASQVSISS